MGLVGSGQNISHLGQVTIDDLSLLDDLDLSWKICMIYSSCYRVEAV